MAERTTITQVTQIGVEVTPGTAVAATKRLGATSIEPSIQAEVQTFRPAGVKFNTIGALGKEWTEASIEGPASYTDLAYLLAGALSYAAPVQQGSTSAYLWTFTPSHTAEDVVKTYTVERGSAVRAGRFSYGAVNELGIAFSRESVDVSGSMLGQLYEDGITMTAGATAIALQPVLPTEVSVYLDSTGAAIGTTKLTRAFQAEWKISNRFGPLWPLNSANTSFATTVETAPESTLTLMVEANAAGMGPLTAMRAGSKQFIRIEAIGPLIATPYTWKLVIDMCGLVSEVGEFSDEDGVYAVQWTFAAAYDATWAKALTVGLTNTLSGL